MRRAAQMKLNFVNQCNSCKMQTFEQLNRLIRTVAVYSKSNATVTASTTMRDLGDAYLSLTKKTVTAEGRNISLRAFLGALSMTMVANNL